MEKAAPLAEIVFPCAPVRWMESICFIQVCVCGLIPLTPCFTYTPAMETSHYKPQKDYSNIRKTGHACGTSPEGLVYLQHVTYHIFISGS